MTVFKLAWKSIADDWPGFAWWEKAVWVVLFVPLFLIFISVLAIHQSTLGVVKCD